MGSVSADEVYFLVSVHGHGLNFNSQEPKNFLWSSPSVSWWATALEVLLLFALLCECRMKRFVAMGFVRGTAD